jgi:AraC-like DNA-binding protein
MPLVHLHTLLRRVFDASTTDAMARSHSVGLYAGLESRSDPSAYRWEGRKRSVSEDQPFVLWQYTLAGTGHFEDAAGSHPVPPAHAMLAVIPSDHLYTLPPKTTWTFFWVILHHPYIVRRLSAALGGTGTVTPASPDSAVVQAAATLFQGACAGGFDDRFDREAASFRFMLELERHLEPDNARTPEKPNRLLQDARQYVVSNLTRRIDVTELATRAGKTRSHFSHLFRAATGRSPAQYVTDLRLTEAARRLIATRATLKEIAAETGFANANHLCKVFRRKYHLSPGTYRRQGS